MDKGLCCNIHNNCPIYHIDVIENQKDKLQCVECISNKIQKMSYLFIPQLINLEENLFTNNWPPLSDEQLRQKIIQLKNEDIDIVKPIQDFYEEFEQQVNKILSEKKKEQIILAQKVYELKDKIIDQYCKMASFHEIKKCLVQEDQQIEKIENDLKVQIDSQFSKKEEYTSILDCMVRQYELISELNTEKSTQIQKNIIEILQIVDLLPRNNFNFGEEIDIFNFENNKIYQQKLNKEYQINKSDNLKLNHIIDQLQIINEQFTKNMNEAGFSIDDQLLSLQKIIIKNLDKKSEQFKDQSLSIYKQQYLIKQNILGYLSKNQNNKFKNFLRFQSNQIISSEMINSKNYIKISQDECAQYQIQIIKSGYYQVHCYINYILSPEKKYLFKINFYKSCQNSTFYVGLINDAWKNSQDLYSLGIGFQICDINDNNNNNLQNKQINPKEIAYTLEFRICIQDQLFQYQQYPKNSGIGKFVNKSSFQNNNSYYFAFQFLSDYLGDRIEIMDYQELDEFPKNE